MHLGYVFYAKESYSDGWRYLEAAPAANGNFVGKEWGAYGYTVDPAATGTEVGTGAANTANIVTYHNGLDPDYYATPGNYNVNNDGTVAAKSCAELNINGYEDWFLPSQDELNLMYLNLHNEDTPVGGFAAYFYWSSSEVNSDNVWRQNLSNGGQFNDNFTSKYNNIRTRAVRAF